MMKRILAVLLAIFMLCGTCCLADEENNVGLFASSLTREFDYTAEEWISTDLRRATLAMCLLLEYGSEVDDQVLGTYNVFDASVAIDDEGNLYLLVPGTEENALFIKYMNGTKNIGYGLVTMSLTADLCYAVLQATDGITACYQLDEDSILSVVEIFQSVLSGDD